MLPLFLGLIMAKQTLLDMVQEILSDMNSDNVNSISDTIEAQQVATIIKRTYYNMLSDRIWPHTGKLFKLTPSTDSARPTHMRMEDDVIEILWAKYDMRDVDDTSPGYSDLRYMRPEDFLEYMLSRDPADTITQTVIDYNGTVMFINNNHAPTYFTSFDDKHLVFDSFDSTVDSTLQASKTQVFGYAQPPWEMDDDFVPDVPAKAWGYFMAEAKGACFLKIKEVFSQPDGQAAQRQRAWLSREKRRIDPGSRYPDYGRKGPRATRRYRNNHFTG